MNRLIPAVIAFSASVLSLHGAAPFKTVASPDYLARRDGSLKIKNIEMYKDSTVVTFDAFNYKNRSVTVDSVMAIAADGKTYMPFSVEGAEFGLPIVMDESRTHQFRLVYPPIKKKTRLIDIVVPGNGKVISGVRLDGKNYDRMTSDQWLVNNTVP